ncbi:MAG: DUF4314 domain-containing protein [Clostridia bacterium]|nr:DUF4314 domain-containing protein [Clostridia bacterium]
MNKFPSYDTVQRVRKMYPSGTHVELIEMDDPYTDMPPGLRGMVGWVDDIATVHIFWENGSRLGALYGIDRIRKIND